CFYCDIGGMIEINRGTYKYWAVYIGNEELIHVVTPGMIIVKLVSEQERSKKLEDVAASHVYKINNYLDDKYTPRNIAVIMKEVGHTIPYNIIGKNYKHFVTYLRYGKLEF
uniref:LRAT domain-containing protein n=1 Tax=Hucho hucho TaxID=62062 RepID=A0A4W5RP83_9TELE